MIVAALDRAIALLQRLRARFALLPDWHTVLTKAWSARLLAVAIGLSGAEVVLPHFVDVIPRGPFAILSFLVSAGALWARLVYQPTLRPEDGNDPTPAPDQQQDRHSV